jgi:hypothetical protein
VATARQSAGEAISSTAFAAFRDLLKQAEDLLAGIGSVPTLDAAVWELRMATRWFRSSDTVISCGAMPREDFGSWPTPL